MRRLYKLIDTVRPMISDWPLRAMSRSVLRITTVAVLGVGKTHLMMAFGNAALDADVPALFLTVADLLDYLRKTYAQQSPATGDDVFLRLKTVELLLLDERLQGRFSDCGLVIAVTIDDADDYRSSQGRSDPGLAEDTGSL